MPTTPTQPTARMSRADALAALQRDIQNLFTRMRWTAHEYAWVHRHKLPGCDCDVYALTHGDDPAYYDCDACRPGLDRALSVDRDRPDHTDPGYLLEERGGIGE